MSKEPCGHTKDEHLRMMQGLMAGACEWYPAKGEPLPEDEPAPPSVATSPWPQIGQRSSRSTLPRKTMEPLLPLIVARNDARKAVQVRDPLVAGIRSRDGGVQQLWDARRAAEERISQLTDCLEDFAASVRRMAERLDAEPGNQTVVDLWLSKVRGAEALLAEHGENER